MAIPISASGIISHHFSINPTCACLCGILSSVSPIYGIIESLNVAMPIDPTNPMASKMRILQCDRVLAHLCSSYIEAVTNALNNTWAGWRI